MVGKVTRAEKQNEALLRLLDEITEDKECYPYYKAMKTKLEFISGEINTRITNELRKEKDKIEVQCSNRSD